jgi:hypothetical protein
LHPGDWDIDRASGKLYQVGPCAYGGGLAVLDMNTGSSRLLAPFGAPGMGQPVTDRNDHTVCGERISAGSQSLVAIGKTEYVWPAVQNKAILLVMNGRTGKVLHRVRMSTDPMDLIAS